MPFGTVKVISIVLWISTTFVPVGVVTIRWNSMIRWNVPGDVSPSAGPITSSKLCVPPLPIFSGSKARAVFVGVINLNFMVRLTTFGNCTGRDSVTLGVPRLVMKYSNREIFLTSRFSR